MDKSDIPGFVRSDIFLSESDIKARRLSWYYMDFLKMREKTGPRVHLDEGRLKVDDTIIIDLRKASSKELKLLKI